MKPTKAQKAQKRYAKAKRTAERQWWPGLHTRWWYLARRSMPAYYLPRVTLTAEKTYTYDVSSTYPAAMLKPGYYDTDGAKPWERSHD
jgi:hypothetical protein